MAALIPFIVGGAILLLIALVLPLWLQRKRDRQRWRTYYSERRPRRRRSTTGESTDGF